MIKYQDINLDDIPELKTVKYFDIHSDQTIEYYNIPCGFDIETSSTLINDTEKFAFMYSWAFGIKDSNFICYGRTWEEFKTLILQLKKHLKIDLNKRLVVYVHNLGYEFQFMRKYFEWVDVFSVDERKPIKAVCDLGIEFRCSYILSGFSLERLANNLVTKSVKKLVGDLDYKLIRTHETELTEKELAYINNDVEIILTYITEQIEQNGNITKIPMTNTGRVRKFVKDECYFTHKNHKKSSTGKYQRYRELMEELTINLDEYTMLKRCFMGGYTHASMRYSGQLMEEVTSIDFTSSYPSVMLAEKFPMSKPIKVDLRKEDFNELLKNDDYGLMMDIKFNNIHSKLSYETYLSESKCFNLKNPTINNGRIYKADELTTTITNVDFDIMKHSYSWDSIEIANCYKFYMQYLPKSIIQAVLKLYEDKTVLKDVEGSEVEYMLSKGMLNSVYGMTVTDIIRNEINYIDEWEVIEPNETELNEQIDKYNKSKSRFLYYPWGVWITAYSRKNLWTGILNIKEDYIYSDTDSIKLLNYEKHKPFIEWYDKDLENKLKKMCSFRNIDFKLMKPKTKEGIEKMIGVWDFDGYYTHFKTLGSKRYLSRDENGKLELTVAGLSKQNGIKYLERISNNDYLKVFENFTDDLYIPSNETGKNTHTYIDDMIKNLITDYQGKTVKVVSLSSVHLSECEFTLSISKQYSKFLQDLRNGYLYTGIKAD